MEITISLDDFISLYKKEVNNIAEFCDWKTHFDAAEVCSIMYRLFKKNGTDIPIKEKKLFANYMNKVFDIKDEEWPKEADARIEFICVIVYNIVKSL